MENNNTSQTIDNNMFNNERKSGIDLEYKINKHITLKLENGSTFIYINGIKFIQCIRLTINIPKEDITLYDEVDSIDEAAKLYTKHLHQNRIVTGPMAAPVLNQKHDITPEQEFWGHCSNIQAWVEYDYDTRILMSNTSFPLLVELAKNGDLLANNVLKEEIALRLESGYPSVVHYLLEEGFLRFFTPSEFKTIIETTKLIENLVVNQYLFIEFLKYSGRFFPNLIKYVILKLVLLPNGANLLMSVIAKNSKIHLYKFDRKVLNSIKDDLKDFSNQTNVQQSKGIEKAILKIEEYLSEEEEKRRNQILMDDTGFPIYKVIVLGDFNVGKTELLVKFVTDQYNDYTPPIGLTILKKQIELKKYNITANLMLWNVPGLSLRVSPAIFQPFFKGADGMLLVFDVTRSSTFSNINNWYNTAVEYGLSGIPKILIGNKAHLKGERKIILPMAEHLAEKLNAHYYETSTLTGENIRDVFEKIAELIYRAKLNKPKKNTQLIIKPYQGELIEIPEEIPSHEGVKQYSFYEKEDSFLKYISEKYRGPRRYPYIPRSKFEKEKKKRDKDKKHQQKSKSKTPDETRFICPVCQTVGKIYKIRVVFSIQIRYFRPTNYVCEGCGLIYQTILDI